MRKAIAILPVVSAIYPMITYQPWLDIIHDDTTSQPADKEQPHSAKGEIQTGSLLLNMNTLLSIVDESHSFPDRSDRILSQTATERRSRNC